VRRRCGLFHQITLSTCYQHHHRYHHLYTLSINWRVRAAAEKGKGEEGREKRKAGEGKEKGKGKGGKRDGKGRHYPVFFRFSGYARYARAVKQYEVDCVDRLQQLIDLRERRRNKLLSCLCLDLETGVRGHSVYRLIGHWYIRSEV